MYLHKAEKNQISNICSHLGYAPHTFCFCEVDMQAAVTGVKELLNRLPEESSFEDIQYHLYVIAKIQQGLARVESEDAVPHEEVEKQFDCM
ncbi:hypothetical protein NP590_15420 [Methylomonas sp. SURF-2]|uniref:Uncharacterized protein n=1 Tax=Methylomonas subterranea TaxID=2952225 RepID=A0ABT1TJ54_9GAMM|nr:hypothetical protein [Methylomonas sp. SURF-2]MCQ8105501.1 hypothetical protein [Methylomonas sp. SURF-2]